MVALAPSSGANRCRTDDLNELDQERIGYFAAGGAQILREVLHDVHVVRDGEDHHQRRQHAGEDVVGESHEHIQAHRPDEADDNRAHDQQREPPRAEHEEQRADGQEQDRRCEVSQIRLRDLVVGLADLEAAVVVRLHAVREPRVDQAVNAIDDVAAHVVDAVLVEGDDEGRDGPVFRDEITAEQPVREHAFAHSRRRLLIDDIVEERLNLDATVVIRSDRQAGDDIGGGEAMHTIDGVHACDVVRDPTDELEALRREQPRRAERDQQRALAAEFLAEPLVGAVNRIVPRDPHADVVVDRRDVRQRQHGQEAEEDGRAERQTEAVDQLGDARAHPPSLLRASARQVLIS